MAETTYSRWYREGTVTISQNSKTLQGANTYWLNANIKPGDLFSIDSSKFYEVDTIDSNTQITLKTPFEETKITAGTYKIIRNFTSTLAAETAAKVVDVLAKHERYIDEDMKTVQGQSAYEVAVSNGFVGTIDDWLESLTAYGQARKLGYTGTVGDWVESLTAYGRAKANGYTGTESEWLESLIGAGQWNTLNQRTIGLATMNGAHGPAHNSLYRGQYLGNKLTDEQAAAIKNRTYYNLYPGDYWLINNRYYVIAEFETFSQHLILQNWNADSPSDGCYAIFKPHVTVLCQDLFLIPEVNDGKGTPFNDTDTTEGGYIASDFRNKYRMQIQAVVAKDFGEEHLFIHGDYLPGAHNNAGVTTGLSFVTDSCLEMIDAGMVFGCYPAVNKSFEQAYLDNNYQWYLTFRQLAVYRHLPVPHSYCRANPHMLSLMWGQKGSAIARNPVDATHIQSICGGYYKEPSLGWVGTYFTLY